MAKCCLVAMLSKLENGTISRSLVVRGKALGALFQHPGIEVVGADLP